MVDGNTDGNCQAGSVTHTNNDSQAWWQVDLGAVQPVGTVVLWNRTDCCSERLSNFYLRVSDDGGNWQSYAYAATAPTRLPFTVDRTARYVRVQLAGSNILSLAEVQVFPPSTTPILIPGQTFWGTGGLRVIPAVSAADCDMPCLGEATCAGGTFNPQKQACWLRAGSGDIAPGMWSDQAFLVPSDLCDRYYREMMMHPGQAFWGTGALCAGHTRDNIY